MEREGIYRGGWTGDEGGVGHTDVGCDDLGFVSGEDGVGCDANARVFVENVRFEIITWHIWPSSS